MNKIALWVCVDVGDWIAEWTSIASNDAHAYAMHTLKISENHKRKLYIKMHWSLWGISHLSLAKLVNCNQNLGYVADQNYVAFID